MAIEVVFGTYDGDDEIVDKDGLIVWDEDPTNCTRVNTDLLNPILKCDKAIRNYNYISIPFFGRYYFVESIEGLAGTHCLVHCHVDVLYTYATQIKGLTCLVHRNEDIEKWKRDITDTAIIASNRRVIYGTEFGDSLVLDEAQYILGTIGETQ